MRLQLDMFAVELGAAILLQFETEDGIVRVLADAGEAKHHVDAKLAHAIDGFTEDNDYRDIHIDLMIGTHYDSDHLAGLVAIIEDPKVTIGEAWMPPVANDAAPKAGLVAPGDADYLALQFARDDGDAVLQRYLDHKADICVRLAAAEREGDEVRALFRFDEGDKASAFMSFSKARPGEATRPNRDFFEWHLEDANRTLGRDPGGHADEVIEDPWTDWAPDPLEVFAGPLPSSLPDLSKSWSSFRPDRAEVEAPALALIRRAAAKDAITATSLAAVVKALKARNVPIACRTIADGKPRPFVWSKADKRFVPGAQISAEGPALLLLGPSDSLVRKQWARLPIGDYATKIAYMDLPIEPITPSNQLSYILRVDYGEARILVTGDAGCVDFKPSTIGAYHPALIEALAPLDVIQVAHHGGMNAHFYRCLLAANYAAQESASFLLLSHATNDKHRPSSVFAKFIEEVRKDGDDVQLVFTSQPKDEKVRDFKALFAPVVGSPGSSGDVQMRFDQTGWTVTAHAVAAP
ncbi:MAG: hypothetical protein KKE02_24220 [Alphaproteobacteria bacterium]|nr:hypothetical protein [Alphaproteobacteria bacterium]MBU1516521.1 hypothetical protein [Alphaproteobacteria bacterium]MBU2094278.1 hypothetical protein [Alphaproteobacteria bacterium]MBU2154145.1 hypothetical protein [Alphaproteobacteria bacterium]MBU2307448.1 hypothetical protein [Alphaproteobacteria bacterium]